ncbi:MAG: toxin-antitoxin system HicB family antitoxin [Deltaproteobacteria bacterium]|nr:toxin-antitoxin system HicB family antitoxin [Deltaproteobacteria bacterium]
MKALIEKYTYRVEWSEEDDAHIATCLELSTLKAHGKTMEQALKAIKRVVMATLKWMKEDKEEIPEPFSTRQFKGNLSLRTSPEVHRLIATHAAEQGVSINQYILSRMVE